jgi:hypothetical protein
MLSIDPAIDAGNEDQAVIWVDRHLKDRVLTGHNGGDLGSFTELYFDRETGIGFAMLFNATPESGEDYEAIVDLQHTVIDLAAAWSTP